MEEELINTKNTALSFILEAKGERELEEIRLQFLGKSGKLTLTIKGIAKLPIEKRPEIGVLANDVKKQIEDALGRKLEELLSQTTINCDIDQTDPGIPSPIGHLHPTTQVLNETIDIFKTIGFQVADGPEIETDYYNFEALNIPKDHPSRDTQQTLFLDTRNTNITPGEIILRTQTSAMQGRIMEKIKPPLRVIVPGKVYRYEQVDASHGFEFWQLEGFMIDKNVTLTDLFGTLTYFLKQLFGEDTKVRFTCHNFPFVEPGVEAYMSCSVCKGKGCGFCKKTGWVEVLGAGMIHPNVLKTAKIDPKEWQGFAFGTGFSRIIALTYQINDLRTLTNPDVRVLNKF